MITFITAVQKAFINQLGFPENPDAPGTVLLGSVPDDTYCVKVDDVHWDITVRDGAIHDVEKTKPMTYVIVRSHDGTETGMFPRASDPELNKPCFGLDVDGQPMKLVKEFDAYGWMDANRVYNEEMKRRIDHGQEQDPQASKETR